MQSTYWISHVARPVRILKPEKPFAAGNLCLSTQTPEIENDRIQRPKHSMKVFSRGRVVKTTFDSRTHARLPQKIKI
mgnify:CR=1 FL=1